jgi:hypothetical protein
MSITFASERRLIAQDEFEPVVRSHYPVVEGLSREELMELARLLRARRKRTAKRRRIVRAARIGSVSQSVRNAQAARDSRAV